MAGRANRVTRNVAFRIRDARNAALVALPNVVGTMIGKKYTDEESQAVVSVIVLVNKKRPLSRLRAGDAVPKYLRLGKWRVRTDVLAVGPSREQAWSDPVMCQDKFKNGLVSLFCREGAKMSGVTCAHVLAGVDGDPETSTDVLLRHDRELVDYKVGRTERALYNKVGRGVSGDYGFDDAISFAVDAAWAISAARALPPLNVAESRMDTKVTANTASAGKLKGVIRGVAVKGSVRYCDYLIKAERPGTRVGDSGVLWRSANGDGVAIHARGGDSYDGAGSSTSWSMSAARMLRKLGLDGAQYHAWS